MTERYALSFTTGGLLWGEALKLAEIYLELGVWEEVSRTARDRNALQARTSSSSARVVLETLQRLRTLTDPEIALMIAGGPTEGRHLMWAAVCRRYSLIAEFSEEVVRERFLVMRPVLEPEAFEQFVRGKSLWHPELVDLKPSTATRLRQNLFRMLREVGILGESGDIIPVVMSERVVDAFNRRSPSDIRFFPTTTSAGAEQ